MQKHFDELSALISPSSPAPSTSTVSDSTMESSPSASSTVPSVSSDSHPPSSSYHRANHPILPANHNATRVAAALAAAVSDPGKAKGRDRFPCTFPACNLSFHRRYNLKVHFRKHTNEKPYACREPGCTSAFKWRSSAKHHMISHERKKAIPKPSTPTRAAKPPHAVNVTPTEKPQHPVNGSQYSNHRLPIPPKSIDVPVLPPMLPKIEDINDGLFIHHQPDPFYSDDFANLSAFNPRPLPVYDPIFFPNDFSLYPFSN